MLLTIFKNLCSSVAVPRRLYRELPITSLTERSFFPVRIPFFWYRMILGHGSHNNYFMFQFKKLPFFSGKLFSVFCVFACFFPFTEVALLQFLSDDRFPFRFVTHQNYLATGFLSRSCSKKSHKNISAMEVFFSKATSFIAMD